MLSDMTIAVLIECIIGVAAATLAMPTILSCFFPQVVRALTGCSTPAHSFAISLGPSTRSAL
jgi:hypothetical protein